MPHIGELMHLLLPGADEIPGLVALLLHFDGADGSTTFIDSSQFSRGTVNQLGGVHIRTAESKFGGASGYFDGDALISYATSESLQVGTGDFTIACWVRPSASGNSWGCILGLSGSTTGVSFYARGASVNKPIFYASGATLSHQTTATADVWHHYACTRQAGVVRVFLDGVCSTSTLTYTGAPPATTITVGCSTTSQNEGMTAYYDDFVFIKGAALWVADFTPPTEAFPNP